MRARSHSGVRLDQLMLVIEHTIIRHQDPITGLFANNDQDFPGHAWVRDNLYAAQALWAMHRAFCKSADYDEDVAKATELRLTCVKIMQSLLECMMRQTDKVEQFKLHQRHGDALHAKYSVKTKGTVCGDDNWGHLQIDATSLFLLTLAQMTASGLQIIRNFDEVAFVQNLVYYLETGYRTPDFGIWERGDKTNQGIRELNASSIGMVKAALQAINDVGDLFGDGSKGSVIHVLPDQIQQCSAVLSGILPRESFSKETDAALLSIISYPAFAVEDPDLVRLTRDTITETLLGRYGCRRFLRDGYKTPVEDPNRLYYRNDELQQFEGIECEWPLFLCYFLLDSMFSHDEETTAFFWKQLDMCLVENTDSNSYSFIRLVPELYKVPCDAVMKERDNRGSQVREPAGVTPFLWAQSLYIICSLLHDGFLSPAEIDPLSRRLSIYEKRPPCEVQVVILADDAEVQKELAANDIIVQCVDDLDPVFLIQPSSVFSKILSRLGESKKLKLTGRPMDRDVGLLSTSKLYQLDQRFIVFTPQFMDRHRSHLMYDIRILMDEWSSELQYIYSCWNSASISGRPLVVLVVSKNMLQSDSTLAGPGVMNRHMKATVTGTIKKINNGYLGGARVVMKNLSDFFRTTAVSTLEFHNTSVEDLLELGARKGQSKSILDETASVASSPAIRSSEHPLKRVDSIKDRRPRQFNLVHKTSMRHRSIVLDSNDSDLVQLRLAYTAKVPPTPTMSPLVENKPLFPSLPTEEPLLHTTWSSSSLTSESSGKLDMNQMGGMNAEDLVDMLKETNVLDEQASIIHCLWMKFGKSYDTNLNGRQNTTVKMLMNEVYSKACDSRDWALVRLTSGLLTRYLDELPMSVNHLLVRQKQLTVGMPSKNEEAITCPKTKEEMRSIMMRAYGDDPNSFTLSQEIIIFLGSLVRTEPKLFVEMFRLRIGLIIQVMASELARLRNLNAEKATQSLLTVSPYELKSMLLSLLSGRLLEEADVTSERGGKELRTGMGSFRKQLEERKSMRKSIHGPQNSTIEVIQEVNSSDSDDSSEDDFQFGIWLRHRRIDGALNRVPPDFYATVWDSVRMFPHGLSINEVNLHWGVTQEMTRREIKFALQVEQVLNQVAEPEYREMIVEALTLIGKVEQLLKCPPIVCIDRPFVVDSVVKLANELFVEHNVKMETIVMECCGSGKHCDGAQGMCKHFYDSAPAGEFGTAHYMIRALIDIFGPKE